MGSPETDPQTTILASARGRIQAMDSAYDVRPVNRGRDVVINASYCGVLPARFIAEQAPRGAIGIDCAIGLEGAGIAGLSSACAFVVALSLPPAVASPSEVHQLSAGMFTIGYVTAFVLPLLGGLAWDVSGQPRTAFLPAALGAMLLGTALNRRRRPGVPDLEARLH